VVSGAADARFGRAQCYVDGEWSTPSGDPATVAIDPFTERFAGRLHCGQVKINGVHTRDRPSVPFGGTKLSGYGRELGALGLAGMTDVTAVMS
jgi:acyl-CoA reductase-like NAD-dependent aldehyde dehydrogenase